MSIALPPAELTDAQRVTLAEWQAQLEKLVQHQRTCRARAVHGSLGVHLSSAIRGAHEAIAEVCAAPASELLSHAAESIVTYFRHAGDARQAAAQFPAFAALRGFLRGWKGEDTLAGLANQADATAKLIGRLLGGKIVWEWEGAGE